jgi:hypothetical protein
MKAAQLMKMSYSTAKKILRKFKRSLRFKLGAPTWEERDRPRAAVKELAEEERRGSQEVQVLSTVAGNSQERQNCEG